MNDFNKVFQNLSNVELLKILKNRNDYQPEAVLVAERILAERNVTDDERQLAEKDLHEVAEREKKKGEKYNWLTNKIQNYFNQFSQPDEKLNVSKWLKIFLLLVTILYLRQFYSNFKTAIFYFNCDGCNFNILDVTVFLMTLLYVPLVLYLLLKRKRWGWIFLFADNLFTTISLAFSIYRGYKTFTLLFLFWTAVRIVFLLFLWRTDIASFFNIDKERKEKYAIRIGAIVAILLTSWLISIYT